MKKVKLAFWIILLLLFGLLIYQNQSYFLSKHSLAINLYFTAGQTVPIFNLIIIVAVFFLGLLIAYSYSLLERFKAGKTIKALRASTFSLQSTIDGMKKDIDALKSRASEPDAQKPAQEPKTGPPEDEAEPTPQN